MARNDLLRSAVRPIIAIAHERRLAAGGIVRAHQTGLLVACGRHAMIVGSLWQMAHEDTAQAVCVAVRAQPGPSASL